MRGIVCSSGSAGILFSKFLRAKQIRLSPAPGSRFSKLDTQPTTASVYASTSTSR